MKGLGFRGDVIPKVQIQIQKDMENEMDTHNIGIMEHERETKTNSQRVVESGILSLGIPASWYADA